MCSARTVGAVLSLLWAFLGATRSVFRTRRELALENLALRQQVALLIRTRGKRRVQLGVWDRSFWVILSQRWEGWRNALAIVDPATVVRWDVTITKLHLLQAVRNKQRSSCLSIRSEALRFR